VLERGQLLAKKYALDRPAGFGGMAQLWVATNQATGAEVCVKLLVPEPDTGCGDEAVERFRREAHAAASLSHRAIVRVFDLLELDERGDVVTNGNAPHAYAIVMELLRGETLGEMLAKRGKLPVEETLDLFLPVVSALGHAHRASVIHRDLKPDNIFLAAEPDGHVIAKVLDFGVSKLERAEALTSDGVVVGTPTFMSPEQASGARSIDARSDVFSAGILLYMMLSGRNPFENAPTFEATIDAVIRRDVVPIADLAPPIWAVIQRAIEKDPAGRWNDCTEMGIALRKAAGRRSTTESDPYIAIAPSAGTIALQRPNGEGAGREADRSDPSPSFVAAADVRASVAANRRRTIVMGIVVASALVVLVALVLTALKPKRGDASLPSASNAPVVNVPALAASASLTVPPSVSDAEPEPAASAVAASASAPQHPSGAVVPGVRSSAPRRAPNGSATMRPSGPSNASSSPRKPGHQPNIARDPGF
jgi:serine/threonine-protein kinase